MSRERQLVSLRPALIHGFWRGLPPSLEGVDAVYERAPDHKIVFLKGADAAPVAVVGPVLQRG